MFYQLIRKYIIFGLMIIGSIKKAFLSSKGFCNMRINMQDGDKGDVQGMESISKLPFYQNFKQGMNLTVENKLEQANQHYQSALNLLQNNRDELKDHYMHIYKKLIMNNFALKKSKAVEENLYSLIKLKKKSNIQSTLLYDDFNSLFQLHLTFNPQKAILLGKALLSEKQSDNLTLKHKKIFQFNLGNAYFLIGNYEDAKIKYSQCLQNQPSSELKIKVYNNLALSCWWHKNPIIQEKSFEPSKHREDLIDSSFKQARQLFLKAIEISEDPESVFEEQAKYRMKQALGQYQLDLKAQFFKSESILPIYNLLQYYIHNEPNERIKILFWLRILLKLSKSHNHPRFDEIYTTFCLLNNQKEELKNHINGMITKYKGQVEQVYYQKVNSFLLRADRKAEQSNQSLERANKLEQQLRNHDEWVFKRKYLSTYSFSV